MGLQEVTAQDERPLQEIADTLAGSHKIILVTGAGISTSCGIPDFRSKDGLYNMIPTQHMLPTPPSSQPSTPTHNRISSLNVEEELPSSQSTSRRSSLSPSSRLRGQDLFDSRVFQSPESTTVFYQFIASMRQKIREEVRATSSVHKFVRVLRDGGRLMRCYTQNIDGLEAREELVTDLRRGKGNKRRFMKKNYEKPRPVQAAGTDFDGGCEVVQLHGDLDRLRCTMCSTQYEWTEEETDIYLEGAAPKCPKCHEKSEVRQASGKRGLAVGSLRPNIVLYGEDHPSNTLLTPLIPFDASCQPEVLIIMGTSLKVFGLQKIVREFAKAVHARKNGKGRVIFVNRTRPAESVWEGIIDDYVAMDCDDWVEDLKKRRHDLWLRQGEIDLTVVKSGTKRKRNSMADSTGKENTPTKKAKIVVEVPSLPHTSDDSSTAPRKTMTPKKLRRPYNYPGREILSPLVQAMRPPYSPLTPTADSDGRDALKSMRRRTPVPPPVSPLTSPIRPTDEPESRRPGLRETPRRPAFSPLSPRVYSNQRSQTEDDQDKKSTFNSNANDSMEPHVASGMTTIVEAAQPTVTRESGFLEQMWNRVRPGRIFSSGRSPELHYTTNLNARKVEDDVMEVETPSRGPRGRKINVFADLN